MHILYEQANGLTEIVIGAAITVQNHFGVGLLESIYVKSLARELNLLGHDIQMERAVKVSYKGADFEERLRFDLMVDGCLLIEAKVVDGGIHIEHRRQLLSYMRLMDIPLGLVLNFNEPRLGERGVGRVILKGADIDDGADRV